MKNVQRWRRLSGEEEHPVRRASRDGRRKGGCMFEPPTSTFLKSVTEESGRKKKRERRKKEQWNVQGAETCQ